MKIEKGDCTFILICAMSPHMSRFTNLCPTISMSECLSFTSVSMRSTDVSKRGRNLEASPYLWGEVNVLPMYWWEMNILECRCIDEKIKYFTGVSTKEENVGLLIFDLKTHHNNSIYYKVLWGYPLLFSVYLWL